MTFGEITKKEKGGDFKACKFLFMWFHQKCEGGCEWVLVYSIYIVYMYACEHVELKIGMFSQHLFNKY